jgi:predicted metal-binding membrane protein
MVVGARMIDDRAAEAAHNRDRVTVLIGIVAVIVVASIYTVSMSRSYDGMAGAVLSHHGHAGHAADGFLELFVMWTVMQVAMMSPTVVPMILMHAKVERYRRPERSPAIHSALFFAGYIAVWVAFSAVFALVQMTLQSAAMLSPQMASASPWLAGGILIAAGRFQSSKLKEACLKECRSPVTYLLLEWREGTTGALRMGAKHGVHCAGCCWALMALLFVAGVMNVVWMALITAFMLIEKVMPEGDLLGRLGGIGMTIWGICLIVLAMAE